MRYWAVDQNNLDGKELAIKSNRRVSISKGDYVILFYRDYRSVEFNSYGRVAEAIRERNQNQFYERTGENEGEEEGEYYSIVARLAEIIVIENPLTLDDLAYSLEKVYRYDRPYRHFSRQYVALSLEDFETITNGLIYWSRTTFGVFINALRSEQLERFVKYLAEYYTDILLSPPDYDKAWQALRIFIEREYIAAADLLKEIHHQTNSLNAELDLNLYYNELGLSSDEDSKANLLYEQEQLLSDFTSSLILEKENILQEISTTIKISDSENRFQKIFRRTPWPLHTIRI